MSLIISVAFQRDSFALDVNACLPTSGITAIFGPSGCGKTTLLRAVAGLEEQVSGSILFNGDTWLTAQSAMPAWQRPVGMVFQTPSLFPHLTVAGNLQYARKRATQRQDSLSVERITQLTGIGELLSRKPDQLSGGQQQRVAIARALVGCPALLLMDEPLANLDGGARHELLLLLRQIHIELDIPILYVSHQLDEVVQLADHLMFMQNGQGKLVDGLQAQLNSERGRQLSGGANVVFVQPCDTQQITNMQVLQVGEQKLQIPDPGYAVDRLLIYANDISMSREAWADSSITNQLSVQLESIEPATHQAEVFLKLRLGSQYLLARITRQSAARLQLQAGQQLIAHVKAVALR
ncbi:MAG: molybdenum ABC transporter ATP-binding protein [Idiomarina sp.]|nr:molybdenum ABC transporter ATP-binding protein [Idiomarina sp.]